MNWVIIKIIPSFPICCTMCCERCCSALHGLCIYMQCTANWIICSDGKILWRLTSDIWVKIWPKHNQAFDLLSLSRFYIVIGWSESTIQIKLDLTTICGHLSSNIFNKYHPVKIHDKIMVITPDHTHQISFHFHFDISEIELEIFFFSF